MRRLTGHDHEEGAVAVMFALVLVVLIGFIGAGVDVASAYAKAQEVQNAADAGALAVAQQCATTGCAGGSALAQELAVSNIRLEAGSVATTVTYPAGNRVTVAAEGDHHNFFLGLFGQPRFRVHEEATASWSSPRRGPAMLPLTISSCSFVNQTTGQPNLNTQVTIYMPGVNQGNGNSPQPAGCTDPAAPPAGFGWLDSNAQCESQLDAVVGDWYQTGSNPGLAAESCVKAMLPSLLGEVVLIPIYSAIQGQGEGADYFVRQFAAFKIEGYRIQTGNLRGGAACAASPLPNNAYTNTCLVGRFIEWTELGGDYSGGAPPTEVTVISLVD